MKTVWTSRNSRVHHPQTCEDEAYRPRDGGKEALLTDSKVRDSVYNSKAIYRSGNKLGRLDATNRDLPPQLGKSLVRRNLYQNQRTKSQLHTRGIVPELLPFAVLLGTGIPIFARMFED
jgi:hypothetical protein